MWNLLSNQTIKIVNNLNLKFILFIFILLFTFSNVNAVEITNFSNIFAEITGMYDSKEHGLVFSNSLGLFKLDKETGKIDTIYIDDNYYSNSYTEFFEYQDMLHFYKKGGILYRIKNGVLEIVSSQIFTHYVLKNTLYLIRYLDPRIQIFYNGRITEYKLEEKNYPIITKFIEINNELIGFFVFNGIENSYVIKFNKDKISFMMDPNNLYYLQFKENLLSDMFNINNEICFKSEKGLLKFDNGLLYPMDNSMSFLNQELNSLSFKNGIFIGYKKDTVFALNYQTKELTLLYDLKNIDLEAVKLFIIKGNIYFQINDSLFIYDFASNKLIRFNLLDSGIINIFSEDLEQKLLVAKEFTIEWYKEFPPKVFGLNSVITNKFLGITYDNFNKKIVALGKSGDNFIIQTYDGVNWNSQYLPKTILGYNDFDNANIEADLKGNYIFAYDEFLYNWDGKEWTKHSFLSNPEYNDKGQREYYSVLCRDSLGGVWISTYLDEYNSNFDILQNSSHLWRYFDGEFKKMSKVSEADIVNGIQNGVCLRDGTCIFDVYEKFLYRYQNGKFDVITVSDGLDIPKTNNNRRLNVNAENQLILTFIEILGWSSKIGTYHLNSGISIFSDEKWDHTTYKDYVLKNNSNLDHLRVIFDAYGKNWIINDTRFIKIINDNSFYVYNLNLGYKTIHPYYCKMLIMGNDCWFTDTQQGLYKFTLSDPTSVEDKIAESKSILKSELITNSIIELNETVENYSIYTINGNFVDSGKNCSLINSDKLESGTYFIVIPQNNGMIVNKFVVVK